MGGDGVQASIIGLGAAIFLTRIEPRPAQRVEPRLWSERPTLAIARL